MLKTRFEAIGTSWEIEVGNDISGASWQVLLANIQKEIADFDQYFSRFIHDSFISRLTSQKGTLEVREDFTTLLLLYLPLYHLSQGLFTPLIGQQLVDAGYDATYSLQEKKLHDIPALTDVVEVLDSTYIQLKQPVLFDFGAIGKGYLIDKIVSLLKERGVTECMVDAGGDIYVCSASDKQKLIGLEHPFDLETVVGTVLLCNRAICGSAGNRRRWGKFHHIVNPKTKSSPTDILAIWVVASSTAIADGLSTALFFVEPKLLEKQYQFEYVIMYADQRVDVSPHFSGELFTE